jgi:hypothetical protein
MDWEKPWKTSGITVSELSKIWSRYLLNTYWKRVWESSSTTNKYRKLRLNSMHNLQSKFIAKSVKDLNYRTTCFGLWRPSSGQEFEYSKVEYTISTTGMIQINNDHASQGSIQRFEYLKRKLYRCNASIYFNKQNEISILLWPPTHN